MIRYTYTAPTLPTEKEQAALLGHCEGPRYKDKAPHRKDRSLMIQAMTLRGGETLRIATAAVLGSGDDLRRVLRQLSGHGITLHIMDIDELVPLTENVEVTTDLPEWTKANNMTRRGRKGYRAAEGKVGAKRVTTGIEDQSIIRMAKTHTQAEIAASLGVSVSTVVRRMKHEEQ